MEASAFRGNLRRQFGALQLQDFFATDPDAAPPDPSPRLDGPLVSGQEPGALVLPDSRTAGLWWWVPVPELHPARFRYVYRVTGASASGTPTIAADVTVGLRWTRPETEIAARVPAGADAQAIRLDAVHAVLRIPYVDEDTGDLTVSEFPMSVAFDAAAATCTVEIDRTLARAAYGALAVPGFQTQPATVEITRQFAAVLRTPAQTLPGEIGGLRDSFWLEIPLLRDFPVARVPPVVRPVPGDDDVPDVPLGDEPIIDATRLHESARLRRRELISPMVVERAILAPDALRGRVGRVADTSETRLRFTVSNRPALHRLVEAIDTSIEVDLPTVEQRSAPLPVLVPCKDHPDLYCEDEKDGAPPRPVGCQEAFQLGIAPSRRFVRLPEMAADDRYMVWESQHQPAMYLLAPSHYRVSRAGPSSGPGATGLAESAPLMQWTQVFDATHDQGLPCLLEARLVPDLTGAEIASLTTRLRERAGRPVTLLLPTSTAAGVTAAAVTSSTLTVAGGDVVIDATELALALRVAYSDAVVVSAQLRGGAAVMQVGFDAGDDRIDLSTTLHLDPAELAGPWPAGPVTVTKAATGLQLRNGADTDASVTALWQATPDGSWQRLGLQVPLAMTAGSSVGLPAELAGTPPDRPLAVEAQVMPLDTAQLAVRSVFLENLHAIVLLRRDVDFTAAGLQEVVLSLAIGGVTQANVQLLGQTEVIEVTLVQPLVSDRPSLDRELAITATVTGTDGATRVLAPVVVDLGQGAIVRLSKVLGP